MRPISAVLIGATCGAALFVIPLVGLWLAGLAEEPKGPDAGPNIGQGLLTIAGMFAVPIGIGWALWLSARLTNR